MENLTNILKILNNSFKDLTFDEFLHEYKVNNKKYESVSKRIKQFYKPFDKNIANFVAKKQNKTVNEILSEWDNKRELAALKGTNIHKFAEDYFNKKIKNISLDDKNLSYKIGIFKYFQDLNKNNLKPIFSEYKGYHKKFEFAGTIDMILYNELFNGIVIDDFKTNKDLFKNYGDHLYEPFLKLKSNPFNKYQLQLNHYELILKQLEIPIINKRIIHIKPYSYDVYIVDNYTKQLKEYYENNRINTESAISLF